MDKKIPALAGLIIGAIVLWDGAGCDQEAPESYKQEKAHLKFRR